MKLGKKLCNGRHRRRQRAGRATRIRHLPPFWRSTWTDRMHHLHHLVLLFSFALFFFSLTRSSSSRKQNARANVILPQEKRPPPPPFSFPTLAPHIHRHRTTLMNPFLCRSSSISPSVDQFGTGFLWTQLEPPKAIRPSPAKKKQTKTKPNQTKSKEIKNRAPHNDDRVARPQRVMTRMN